MSNLDEEISKISKSTKTQNKIKSLVLEWAFTIGIESIGILEEGWPDNGNMYSNEVIMTNINNHKIRERERLCHLTGKDISDLLDNS